MKRKCIKGGWWYVLAVIIMQCADAFWLSSLCDVLMCFCCHHYAACCVVLPVITVQHPDVLSHLYHQQNISSSVGWWRLLLVLYTHPARGNRILCKLYTSIRLHIAHPWMLQSLHHTLVFNQVTKYSESWLASWESPLCGFLSLLRQMLR